MSMSGIKSTRSRRRYDVRHDTTYRYAGSVAQSIQLLHLKPRPSPFQTCTEHALVLTPEPFSRQDGVDAFGNPTSLVDFLGLQEQLVFSSRMQVEVSARPFNTPGDSSSCAEVAASFAYRPRPFDRDQLDASRFLYPSPHVPRDAMFRDWAVAELLPTRPVRESAEALMRHIHQDFTYLPGATDLATPTREVIEKRQGVCQDFAHVMIAGLRACGIPARYVSGYIRTGNDSATDDPSGKLIGADASHAWVSVFCPPLGWIDFDPTNNCTLGTDHITIAWGRDFSDVSPLRGVLIGSGEHQLTVAVAVRPVE
ncbi:MAG: transglutaminase family protein [Dokdonella sp.]